MQQSFSYLSKARISTKLQMKMFRHCSIVLKKQIAAYEIVKSSAVELLFSPFRRVVCTTVKVQVPRMATGSRIQIICDTLLLNINY